MNEAEVLFRATLLVYASHACFVAIASAISTLRNTAFASLATIGSLAVAAMALIAVGSLWLAKRTRKKVLKLAILLLGGPAALTNFVGFPLWLWCALKLWKVEKVDKR